MLSDYTHRADGQVSSDTLKLTSPKVFFFIYQKHKGVSAKA